MKGWIRVPSSSTLERRSFHIWERKKMRVVLVVNLILCKLLGGGGLPLMLPLGLTNLNEILALDLPPSMHTYP